MILKHIFMYIWKEAIHGNRHADQDADKWAWHKKRNFEESGLLQLNLKETDTIFGVFF